MALADLVGGLAPWVGVGEALSGLNPPPYLVAPTHRVSLVVPAYMEAGYIDLLLISARNQTYPVSEMVVADSSPLGDLTEERAQDYGARVVKVPADNIAMSRNLGAEATSGDILLFCDADVIMSQRFVEAGMKVLESGAVLAHPKETLYDSTLWNLATWTAQLMRQPWYTTRCVMVWREGFDAVGGYDPACNPLTHRCREDVDFGMRVAALYGVESLKVLPPLVTTSARRYRQFGLQGWRYFHVPAR